MRWLSVIFCLTSSLSFAQNLDTNSPKGKLSQCIEEHFEEKGRSYDSAFYQVEKGLIQEGFLANRSAKAYRNLVDSMIERNEIIMLDKYYVEKQDLTLFQKGFEQCFYGLNLPKDSIVQPIYQIVSDVRSLRDISPASIFQLVKKHVPEDKYQYMDVKQLILMISMSFQGVMDTDKGLAVKLPPYPNTASGKREQLAARNVLEIWVKENGVIEVNGEALPILQLQDRVFYFLTDTSGSDQSPEIRWYLNDQQQLLKTNKAIISLKNQRGTSYQLYKNVYELIVKAYKMARDKRAEDLFNRPYNMENPTETEYEENKLIRKLIPMRISEAEPVD